MWHIKLLTIFPEMFPGPLAYSIAGKAAENNLFKLEAINLRNYAADKHQTVDDKIFGGGAGMLMRPDVIGRAIEDLLKKEPNSQLIYFSPRGKQFNQAVAEELVTHKNIIMLCGRYEGVDQRVFQKYNFTEYSLGDYILSGGEIAALTIIDSCIRLLPGVIGNNEVNKEESFASGEYSNLLEYDQYTRPAIWENMEVPEILLSGHHKNINKWKKHNAVERTRQRRPDLT
jgi:tRNA (guanine37-N1)-methyltransferase